MWFRLPGREGARGAGCRSPPVKARGEAAGPPGGKQRRPPLLRLPKRPRWNSHASDDDMLSPRQILTAFTSLPRVLKLVWATDAVFTVLLALLYAAQGIVPAATAAVSGQLINDLQTATAS